MSKHRLGHANLGYSANCSGILTPSFSNSGFTTVSQHSGQMPWLNSASECFLTYASIWCQ